MKLNKVKVLLVSVLLLSAILRLYKIDKNPVSLFGDEIDVGYQAYSILETGRDYSGNLLPLHFRSLAEWRTPLYIYSAVPTVALFGISPLGVRVPAAVFGVLSVLVIYLLTKEITGKKEIGLIAALILAISPWHLQYSRAGFEVTEMIFLFLAGIYFFLKGLRFPKLLIWSAICLGLTPWVYSTAKLFLPMTLLAIVLIWWPRLKLLNKVDLTKTVLVFVLIVGPFLWSTLFGGGTDRIQGISIFNDPTIIPQIGFDRLNDVQMRGEDVQSVNIADKLFHNQFFFYSEIFLNNYFQSFSTDFLFIRGDYLNLRQSSGSEFYKIEFIFLLLGLIFAVTQLDKKIKFFLIFWLVASPIPSSLTKGGGDHATRLILVLPVLIMLIAFGIYYSYVNISKKYRAIILIGVSISFILSFIFYEHDYWIHYPWRSERWWHTGFEQAIKSVVLESKNYDRVIISSADEPSLKFFLGWSMYPPARFQTEYRDYLSNNNPNAVLKLEKYEFPPVGQGFNLYEMGSRLPVRTLYLATAKEINLDLIKEPGRMPADLVLIKSIQYPSGEPAFYLFAKK